MVSLVEMIELGVLEDQGEWMLALEKGRTAWREYAGDLQWTQLASGLPLLLADPDTSLISAT